MQMTIEKNYKYTFEVNDGFTGGITIDERGDGLTFIHVKVSSESGEPARPNIAVFWDTPIAGSNVFFKSYFDRSKQMLVNWSTRLESSAAVSAPILSNIGYDDLNGLTLAVSDCENKVEMKSCVVEVNANYDNRISIDVQKKVTEYEATIRMDERRLPFYQVIREVGDWWRNDCGYAEPEIPEESFGIVYSTWYAFLQRINAEEVYEECKHFRDLGVKTVILDDGWQGPGDSTPMETNGDWIICEEKFPNMKLFVDSLHELGIKVMLWFPLSYLGRQTKAFETYGKYGDFNPWSDGFITIDPRYPEIRKYLVDTYTRVMRDWSLDGLKLDYIDAQKPNREFKEGMDYESAFDGLRALLDEIVTSIKSVNPRAMIEFRQNYHGPVMHEYGTMFRIMDCPDDSFANRVNTIELRLLGGKSAVHSDMLLWNEKETAEGAAYQLTNTLFSVPQISVRWDETSDEQKRMMRFYLPFIDENRDVLLHGDFIAKGFAADYSYASSVKDDCEIGAVYSGKVAYLRGGNSDVKIVNASGSRELYVESPDAWKFAVTSKDCFGDVVYTCEADFSAGFVKLPVTENGMLEMKKI